MPELRRRSAGATQSYRGSHWNPPAETFDRLGIPWRLGEAQRRYNKRLTTQVPWRATFDTGRRRISTDLAFIETALAKDLRKYICSDFYKDHLQTYKKRPIYWLLQSPAGPSRGGFACLIYLHRYTKDTLNQVHLLLPPLPAETGSPPVPARPRSTQRCPTQPRSHRRPQGGRKNHQGAQRLPGLGAGRHAAPGSATHRARSR
jgi:hypothetical protein